MEKDWAKLPLTVLKFGGASVATPERMRHVAGIVKKIRDQGNRVALAQVSIWQDDPQRPVANARGHFLMPREEG